MTIDRDIRFTPDEIIVTQQALRDKIRKHATSISKAEEARRAGATIQNGTLERHYHALDHANKALNNLNAAQEQIKNRIRAKLGLDTPA